MYIKRPNRITTLVFDNLTLDRGSQDHYNEVFESLTMYLEGKIDYLLQTHIIVIEDQLPINYWSVRIQQHLITYLSIKLRDTPLLPLIVELPATGKGSRLGIPSGLPKREYKIRLKEKAIEMLEIRGDLENAEKIRTAKKWDELSDTVCQAEALARVFDLPTTPEKVTLTIVPVSTNQEYMCSSCSFSSSGQC